VYEALSCYKWTGAAREEGKKFLDAAKLGDRARVEQMLVISPHLLWYLHTLVAEGLTHK
jgi:hypothetical protein